MSDSTAAPERSAALVLETVVTWPGITTRDTPRGATAIVLDDQELGHVHLYRGTLDMPVADRRRARILAEGRARKWFSGWVSKQIATDADAADGLALLRESYDLQHASTATTCQP